MSQRVMRGTSRAGEWNANGGTERSLSPWLQRKGTPSRCFPGDPGGRREGHGYIIPGPNGDGQTSGAGATMPRRITWAACLFLVGLGLVRAADDPKAESQ